MHDTPSSDDDAEWHKVIEACGPLPSLWASVDLTLSSRRAAHAIGVRDSDALREWLRERRLPPYLVLRNWYYVLRLVELAEQGSLAQWALNGERDPATYYRFVAREAGMSWRRVRRGGVQVVRTLALEVWLPWRSIRANVDLPRKSGRVHE
jgi:hypothetical protein